MSGFSGREFGRGNVAVRHVAVLVGFQWRLPYLDATFWSFLLMPIYHNISVTVQAKV
jgi:hypothetical protein